MKVRAGTSFTMEQRNWEKFGGVLELPKDADEENYLSMMSLKLQKGFWRKDSK